MRFCSVSKPDKTLEGVIELPTSKSISNRLLIIQLLSGKQFTPSPLSSSYDTQVLQALIQKIQKSSRTGLPVELNTGNAGTVMRFLLACLAKFPGKWLLTGSERMRMRPIGIQVEALRCLGADIEYLSKLGYPPLLIKGQSLHGGEIDVDASVSSQFISAILMIGPCLPGGLRIHLNGRPVSFPYIDMTIQMMRDLGISVEKKANQITIEPGIYQNVDYPVETDWSAAAFWYEMVALSEKAQVHIPRLTKGSIQGDAILPLIFQNLGVETTFVDDGIILRKIPVRCEGYFFDFSDCPDIAPAVITTCAAIGIRGRFEGLKSLKIKESDRLQALKIEYEKIGVNLETIDFYDMLQAIEFGPSHIHASNNIILDTYQDHRMAMTFAPLALKLGTISIRDPDVVRKSYPDFWKDLKKLGFRIHMSSGNRNSSQETD